MAFTEITSGLDWQAVSFVNEFIKAYNERLPDRTAFTPVPEVAAGDDIQSYLLWGGLQTSVAGQYDSITNTTTDDDYGYGLRWLVPYDWNNGPSTSPPPVLDFSEFCAQSAVMHDDGWRRATTWNPATDDWTDLDDAMWSRAENGHGAMVAGDIIGPWIFDDLQNALDGMRARIVVSTPPLMKGIKKTGTSAAVSDTYATMVGLFDAASEVAAYQLFAYHIINYTLSVQTLTRSAGTFGLWNLNTDPTTGITGIGTWAVGALGSDTVDFYWKAINVGSANDTFDDNADGVTEDNWDIVASSTLLAESSSVGAVATAPAEIVAYTSPSSANGYDTSSPYPVIRFGGLTYIK